MEIRKIRFVFGRGHNVRTYTPTVDEIREIAEKIDNALYECGFRSPYGTVIKDYGRYYIVISNVRLDKTVWGLNVSPYMEAIGYEKGVKRYPILNYWQWGIVNVVINVILDLNNVSANVRSLKGTFVIREGVQKYGFVDWSHMEDHNIGSVMYPIMWAEAWRPYSEMLFSVMVDAVEKKILSWIKKDDVENYEELRDYVKENFAYLRKYCPFYVRVKKVVENER